MTPDAVVVVTLDNEGRGRRRRVGGCRGIHDIVCRSNLTVDQWPRIRNMINAEMEVMYTV